MRHRTREEILVVDDDEDLLDVLRELFQRESYRVRTAASGAAAVASMRSARPALILLDLMLPDMSGLDLCRRFKTDPATVSIPILMLSAKDGDADIVAGLELGADDYIAKTSMSPATLLARVRAALRRVVTPASPNPTLVIDGLTIDDARQEATLGGKALALTYSQFRILSLLASRPGVVFTRDRILANVRGSGYHVTDRAVDVQISGLRKKLGAWGRRIDAVRGVGYRLKA
ncbi:MAG: response regulator transcription factor [Acidobacteriota bacterium]